MAILGNSWSSIYLNFRILFVTDCRIPAYAGNEELRWSTPLVKRKHVEKNLPTPISAVIACRLREGYTIREIVFSKGE